MLGFFASKYSDRRFDGLTLGHFGRPMAPRTSTPWSGRMPGHKAVATTSVAAANNCRMRSSSPGAVLLRYAAPAAATARYCNACVHRGNGMSARRSSRIGGLSLSANSPWPVGGQKAMRPLLSRHATRMQRHPSGLHARHTLAGPVDGLGLTRPLSPAAQEREHEQRLVIVSIIIVALLGGLRYFQFVFKPQMIRSFMAQMTPPPATVERPARAEKWVRAAHVHRHADLPRRASTSIPRSPVSSRRSRSKADRTRSRAPSSVQLDIAVEPADLASDEADTCGGRGCLPAADRADVPSGITSEGQSRPGPGQARHCGRAVNRIEAVIAQKAITAPFSGRLGIRKVRGASTSRPAWRSCRCRRWIRCASIFLCPSRTIGKLAHRPDHRGDGRCLSRPGLQGPDPVARRARGTGHAHAAGARTACQS